MECGETGKILTWPLILITKRHRLVLALLLLCRLPRIFLWISWIVEAMNNVNGATLIIHTDWRIWKDVSEWPHLPRSETCSLEPIFRHCPCWSRAWGALLQLILFVLNFVSWDLVYLRLDEGILIHPRNFNVSILHCPAFNNIPSRSFADLYSFVADSTLKAIHQRVFM